MREFLEDVLEKISQILCFTGSKQIHRRFQAKSTERSAQKSAEKSAKNPLQNLPEILANYLPENPPKNSPQNPPKVRHEIRHKHAPFSSYARLSVAVSLRHLCGLFWDAQQAPNKHYQLQNSQQNLPKTFALTSAHCQGQQKWSRLKP